MLTQGGDRGLRRMIRDSMQMKKGKQGAGLEVYEGRKARIRKRLDEFIDQEWKQKHARRLQKRLRRHGEELLTFLDHNEVPPDNNGGERKECLAVLIRKNSYGNGSERGAQTQAALMTIMRTLKIRGQNPVQILVGALKSYVRLEQLQPLGLAHQQVSEVVKIAETPNRVGDPGQINHQQEAKDGIRISETGRSRE